MFCSYEWNDGKRSKGKENKEVLEANAFYPLKCTWNNSWHFLWKKWIRKWCCTFVNRAHILSLLLFATILSNMTHVRISCFLYICRFILRVLHIMNHLKHNVNLCHLMAFMSQNKFCKLIDLFLQLSHGCIFWSVMDLILFCSRIN